MALPIITAEGRMAKDADLRFTPTGKAVASFTIACSERRKNPTTNQWEDASTTWLDVTVWEGKAEAVAEQLHKGDLVVVTGRLKMREYEKDGQKRRAFDVQADSVAKVVTAAKSSSSAPSQQWTQGQQAERDPWATGPAAGGFAGDDEIPF